VEKLRAESTQAQQGQSANSPIVSKDELEKLLNQRSELLQLRGEVGVLRQAARAATNRQSIQAGSVSMQQLQEEVVRLREQVNVSSTLNAKAACLSNLRQMDGAKAQWALENRKTELDRVSLEDIAPYLKGSQIPVCPGGGFYSVVQVKFNPTCSVPGHTL
jgi:hypothetical protein